MALTKEQVLEQVDAFAESGDEKGLEQYMLDNFAELPEEMQGDLLLSLFSGALEKKAGEKRIAGMQDKAIGLIEEIGEFKKALNEQKRR